MVKSVSELNELEAIVDLHQLTGALINYDLPTIHAIDYKYQTGGKSMQATINDIARYIDPPELNEQGD